MFRHSAAGSEKNNNTKTRRILRLCGWKSECMGDLVEAQCTVCRGCYDREYNICLEREANLH